MSITDLSHLFSTSYVDLKLGKEPIGSTRLRFLRGKQRLEPFPLRVG
jgi:hypothetical protein